MTSHWTLSRCGQALLDLSTGARYEVQPADSGNAQGDRLWLVTAQSAGCLDSVEKFLGTYDSCLAEIRRLALKLGADVGDRPHVAPEQTGFSTLKPAREFPF
jgi:hypothetical protein